MMYIVIWENRHPYSFEVTQHWEEFDSSATAQRRLDGLKDADFVKRVKLMEVTNVLG